jgi:hypothetical protein
MSTPSLAWLQALQADADKVPAGLCTANGSSVAQRFAVHRNNVLSACVQALADTFPVTQSVLGLAFFKAMALVFAQQHLPHTRRMAFYGDGLTEFIRHFAPAQLVPYASDLAWLEMSRVRAYHAADVPQHQTAAALAALQNALKEPEHLSVKRLQLHPSLTLMGSAWAVVSLWQAHQHPDSERDAWLAQLDIAQPEGAAVFRSGDTVLCMPLPLADLCLWRHLHAGQALGQALESASSAASALNLPGPDIQNTLSVLIQHALITQSTSLFGDMT